MVYAGHLALAYLPESLVVAVYAELSAALLAEAGLGQAALVVRPSAVAAVLACLEASPASVPD